MSPTDPSPTAAPSSHSAPVPCNPWQANPGFAKSVERIFQEERVSFGDHGVYNPFVTLATWLWQSLHQSCCRQAVMWLTTHVVQLQSAKEVDTGSYCRARAKLPERVLQRLVVDAACDAEQSVEPSWKWHGREVFLVDGTTASMPDTASNQREYPQPGSQPPGLGFPKMRLVLLFSLATAMIRNSAFGPIKGKETGETNLLRSMLDTIPSGSILVGDRYFCGYWLIAMLISKKIDIVMRLNGSRRQDFRQGTRKGPSSRQVIWNKTVRPDWMSPEEFANLPDQLTLRMVRKTVLMRGFRNKRVIVVTNLESDEYPDDDIASLYHLRWQAELDIRSIKETMKMKILSCKTPDNVRREIWMRLMAYNLCREQAAISARLGKATTPRGISLSACLQAMQVLSSVLPTFLKTHIPPCNRRRAPRSPLETQLSGERVGDRPNRCEPRQNKRRPKPQRYMTKPRAQARAELLR